MAIIETWYNQDLQQPVKVHYLDGSMFSHNGNGNRVGVHVFNNGKPVTLSGTVSGYVVTADGSTVPCTGSRSGQNASILIPAAAYQPGAIFITIFLTDGTTVTTLASVATNVLTARTGNQVSPGSVVTDWTNTINAAMQAVVDANAANMAKAYASLTFPVPLGTYCLNENLLYRCIVPIASSESFTAAHWTRVYVADEVQDEKIALGSSLSPFVEGAIFSGSANILDATRSIAGATISVDGAITSNANRSVSDYIPVNEGDVIYFYCLSGGSVARFAPYTIVAYNSKMEVVSSQGTTERPSSYTVANNSGVRFVRISYYSTTNSPMALRDTPSAPSAYIAYQAQTAKGQDIPGILQDITDLKNGAQSTGNRLAVVENNVGDWYFEKAYTDAQRVFFQFNKVMSKAYFRILSSTGTISNLNIYVSADGFQTQTLLKSVPIVNSDDGVVTFDMTSTTPPATSVRFTFGFTATSTGATKVIVHPIDGVSISDDIVDIETEIDSLRVPNTEVIGTNYNQYVLAGTGSASSPYRVQPAGHVTNPTQYNVMQYEVTAGNVYVLSGFDVSLRANVPMLGFGVNPAGASSVNLAEVMSNGNSTMTDYLLWYKPITDGYIFVAWITGRERVHLYSTVPIAEKYTKANNPFAIKIQLFGDSITDNKWGDQFTWANLVEYNLQDYSVTVVDDAVGGSGIGHGKSTSTQSHQSEEYNYVYDLVTDGTTLQTDANYIVILVGTNNWKSGTALGDMSSTGYETVYGALKGILEYISTHTKATVFVCTIPQRYNSDDQARPTNEYGEPLYNGKTLAEYCEPFRVVSAFYGMPCIHLNEALGWNRINISDFTVDGLHPNYHGDKMLAAIICSEIRKHIGSVPY